MITKPTLLVTGACGYIGSHVAYLLGRHHYPVIALDNLSTGFKGSLLHNEILICEDFGNEKVLNDIFSKYSIQAVLHFAASIVVEDSVKDPLGYYQNNTVNFLKLVQASVKHGVSHFIFSSTAAVYEVKPTLLRENDSKNPHNPYGRSKLMDEWILQDVARISPMRYVALRYFNVAGANQQGDLGQRGPKATHLIKIGCEVAVGKRKSLTIYGNDYATPDGTCVRDYVHVEDLANAHLAALEYLQNGGQSIALNCGYGLGYSVKEVVDRIGTVLGKPIPFSIGPRRSGDPDSLIADNQNILDVLSWKPLHNDLDLIIRSALAWEQKIENEKT